MYGMAALPPGAAPGMRAEGGGRTGRSVFTEGKIFLGGLSYTTTQASLQAYCQSWCAHHGAYLTASQWPCCHASGALDQ